MRLLEVADLHGADVRAEVDRIAKEGDGLLLVGARHPHAVAPAAHLDAVGQELHAALGLELLHGKSVLLRGVAFLSVGVHYKAKKRKSAGKAHPPNELFFVVLVIGTLMGVRSP